MRERYRSADVGNYRKTAVHTWVVRLTLIYVDADGWNADRQYVLEVEAPTKAEAVNTAFSRAMRANKAYQLGSWATYGPYERVYND